MVCFIENVQTVNNPGFFGKITQGVSNLFSAGKQWATEKWNGIKNTILPKEEYRLGNLDAEQTGAYQEKY